jgi:hypothetical protein
MKTTLQVKLLPSAEQHAALQGTMHAFNAACTWIAAYAFVQRGAETAKTGRKLYEGAGITAADLSFENMYDGFTLFHQFHLEGLGYRGMKRGEALDFYQTDISIAGPNPGSPSGGNIGSGRSRFWMHTDCIQQLQGRAGARQITGVTPEVAVSGGPMPLGGNFTVWSATPD